MGRDYQRKVKFEGREGIQLVPRHPRVLGVQARTSDAGNQPTVGRSGNLGTALLSTGVARAACERRSGAGARTRRAPWGADRAPGMGAWAQPGRRWA